ncbi:MAG: DUF748 domain-containing protein [Alphaproteobacteria bacterium]
MRFDANEIKNRASQIAYHPRTRTIAIWIVAIFVALGVLGGLVAPPLLRSKLSSALSEKLHRAVTIEQIRINPYAMTATVRGFLMKERQSNQPAVSFEELRVNLELASLFRWGLVVKEIRLVKPYINLIRNEDRSYNYQDLIKEFMSGPSGPTPRFALNNIEVVDGKVDFDDRPEKTKHTISSIRIGVPFISSLPSQADIKVHPSFSANINGAPFSIKGETRPFAESMESLFRLDIDNLEIAHYLEYSPVELNFKVLSGKLHSRLAASFTNFKNKPSVLKISGNVVLDAFKMVDKNDAPLVSLPAFAVDINGIDPIAGRADIQGAKAYGFEVHVDRARDGKVNLANLVEASGEPAKPEAKKAATPFIYRVAEIGLDSGQIYFADETPQHPYKTRLDNLHLAVKSLTNEADKKATVELTFQSEAKEDFTYNADLQLTPLMVNGKFDIKGFRLAPLFPYYENVVNLQARSGLLNLSGTHSLAETDKELSIKVSDINAAFQDLQLYLAGKAEPLWRVPSLVIKDTNVDVNKRAIAIGAFESQGGKGSIEREPDGTINYARLFKTTSAPEQPKSSEAESPWQVTAKLIHLSRYGVVFDDKSLPTPAKIVVSDLSWRQENFSNAKNARAKITLQTKINDRGALRFTGSAGTFPLGGKLNIEAKEVDLRPIQPYLENQLNFLLTSGRLAAKGNLAFEAADKGPFKAAYQGNVQVTDFASVEKPTSQDLLRWKSLDLNQIQFDAEPMKLRVDEITLDDFYSRLILGADGKMNLQKLVVQKSETKESEPPPSASAKAPNPPSAETASPEKPISIGKINLKNGNINFSDFFIKPNYSANLTQAEGTITELKPEAPGDINIQAKLDNAAPVDINGKINPLGKELYLDMVADARDIELSPMSPYSGKYVGYGIEKGKLSFNVKYKLENRKLDAQNQIILNQLTFGDRVESPTATKLPVLLAVALLKDRNGVIDVNLPISGSLDDPQFSVGGIVLKIILNIITKAVTAPFALIGSMFGGGGEELSYIDFDYGRATLSPAAEAKLKTLATAMSDRPALKLEITAHVDPVNDIEGLKKLSVERKVKAQKFNELARRGEAPRSVDDVQIASGEYERYLKAAYSAESFPKPRNFIGLAKDLPVPEMEALMLKYAQVGPDDLRGLADRRAQVVRDRLLALGKIGPERVFILAPKTEAASEKSKGRSSRVDFSLR